MKKFGLLIAVCIGLVVIFWTDKWYRDYFYHTKKEALSTIADISRNRLEATITSQINAVRLLKTLMSRHPDTTQDDFNQFAALLLQANSAIRSLQYVEAAAGNSYTFPLRAGSKVDAFLKNALKERRTGVHGPLDLQQPNRIYAFLAPVAQKRQFFGLVMGLFDISALVNEVGEDIFSEKVFIRLADADGHVCRGPQKIHDDWHMRKINVAGTQWTMAVGYRQGNQAAFENRLALWLLAGVIWSSFLLVFYRFSNSKKDLTRSMVQCVEEPAGGPRLLSGRILEPKPFQNRSYELKNGLPPAQKTEFSASVAGGVVHEINNILGIILANAEYAIEELSPGNAVRYNLIEIKNASLRGKRVGKQILFFLNNSPVGNTPLNVGRCINECIGLIRAIIPEEIDIKMNMTCQDETIMANVAELDQLLINLCTNAANAMERESGNIEVGLKSVCLDADAVASYDHLQPGDYVKLSVTDTGCGIDPSIGDRIFDPYFTTNAKNDGLGMGLAVAHGIVKHFKGGIQVKSLPGKGTTVEVLFPLLSASAVIDADSCRSH